MDSPRSVPFRQSLLRDELVMGGEREPVMLSNLLVMITGIVSAVAMAWISLAVTVVFYFVSLAVLRRMAKKDPKMTQVWRRYIAYRHHYSARSSYWATKTYRIRK